MKKLFSILCGLIFITQSFGGLSVTKIPAGKVVIYDILYENDNTSEVDEDIQTAWGFSGYNTKESITNKYSIKTDDTKKFKYVRVNAAVNIYQNGAKFCNIELQYDDDESWKPMVYEQSCKIICKQGFSGEKCEDTIQTVNVCDVIDLTKEFDLNTSQIKPEEENIDVFYYNHHDLILLQIVFTKEHSIEVQPIEFYCANDKCSVNTRGNSILLCAPGYKKNDDTNECECEAQNIN